MVACMRMARLRPQAFECCMPQHWLGALRVGTKRAQGVVARSLPTFLATTPTRRGLQSPGSSLASGMGGRRRVEARGADLSVANSTVTSDEEESDWSSVDQRSYV